MSRHVQHNVRLPGDTVQKLPLPLLQTLMDQGQALLQSKILESSVDYQMTTEC